MKIKSDTSLFQNFTKTTAQDWLKKFTADLKGKEPNRYNWKIENDLEFKPIYFESDVDQFKNKDQFSKKPGEFPFLRGKKSSSIQIRQSIRVETVEQALKLTKELIDRGVSSFEYTGLLKWQKEEFYNHALPLHKKQELLNLIQGIDSTDIQLHFKCGLSAGFITKILLELIQKKKSKHFHGSIDLDPIGNFAKYGNLPTQFTKQMQFISRLFELSKTSDSNFKFLYAGGEVYRESGADIVLETACVLATANEYIEVLKKNDFDIDSIAALFHFSFSIGNSYFPEIARLRAFRFLWSRILEQHGLKNKDLALAKIHVCGNYFYKTAYDAHTNILRNTTQAMSAIIGGCDSYTGSGFYALDDSTNYHEFSERITRNTQLVLINESHLCRVTDPSGGSWYIENMTNEMGQAIWKEFQWIESSGGMMEVLKNGDLHKKIQISKENKLGKVSNRKISILGTNQYANALEKFETQIEQLVSVLIKKNEVQISLNDFFNKDDSSFESYLSSLYSDKPGNIDPLKSFRLSKEFEELRLEVEKDSLKSKKTPKVFLYTFGNVAMSRARASFVSNFFGCIGYKIEDNPGFETIEEGLLSLEKSASDWIVLCASDEDYETNAVQMCQKIQKKISNSRILIAGNPKNMEQLSEIGVITNIHARSNVLFELKKLHKMLTVQ